jgi:hypothetical protein
MGPTGHIAATLSLRNLTAFLARVHRACRLPGRMRLPKIAVLIDADNVGVQGIRFVFERLSQEWNPTFRRAYGRGLLNRAQVFRESGIVPVEVVSNSPGKNAADMALVIDAMSELHARRVDAFCLVSGDGDFTRLALAIRERGLPVLGFGRISTPQSLRAACTEFHVLANPTARLSQATRPRRSLGTDSRKYLASLQAEFVDFVRTLIQGNGRTTIQVINQESCKRDPNFSARRYGARNLKSLMKELKVFDVRPITEPSGLITDYEVRLVEVASTTKDTDAPDRLPQASICS